MSKYDVPATEVSKFKYYLSPLEKFIYKYRYNKNIKKIMKEIKAAVKNEDNSITLLKNWLNNYELEQNILDRLQYLGYNITFSHIYKTNYIEIDWKNKKPSISNTIL